MSHQLEKGMRSRIQIRLNRLEGQIHGISAMIESGRSCEEIITQLSAVSAGITAVAREILFEHLEIHVAEGIKSGDEKETIDALKTAVESFAKLK